MKIEKIAVERAGMDSLRLTVSFVVASREELEASDIERVYSLARELGELTPEQKASVERHNAAIAAEVAKDRERFAEKVTAETPTEPVLGRRQRRSAAPAAAPSSPAPEASPVASDAGVRRRRREAAPEAPVNPTAPENEPLPQPTGQRRRRGVSEAAPSADTSPSHAPTAAAPDHAADGATSGRRRRSPAAETQTSPPAATSPSDEIKDADLSKAASEAARVLTPKKVMEDLLGPFGVKGVHELKGGDRRKFLNAVKRALEVVQ